MGALGEERVSFPFHSVWGRLVAPCLEKLLRTLSRREESPRYGQHAAIISAGSTERDPGKHSMPRTAGWAAQVRSPRGGLSEGLVRTRWILLGWASLPGFSGSQADGRGALVVVASLACRSG